MHVVVMGAGVVGMTTAWQLLKDGHEVTVVDRAAEPASFSSHANAGCVGAGFAMAWGSPRAPRMMLRSLLKRDQMIRFRPTLSPERWGWIRAFLRECTAERAAANTVAMARLCGYSRARLREVVAETDVRFDRRTGGLLYFFRTPESWARASAAAPLFEQAGVGIELLDGGEAARRLGSAGNQPIEGGLFAPEDESGDARLFTIGLAERCREAGAALRFNETIRGLVVDQGRVAAVETDKGRIEADAAVVCLGAYSRAFLRPWLRGTGLTLRIHPVKGYSATFPVAADHRPPALGGVDVDSGLAFAPMGARLRLTRTLHFDGYRTGHRPADFRVMMQKAQAAFPNGADYASPKYWAGLRPMTPTGLPVIDRTPVQGLWLNTGQGNFGWTLAAGSAQILADLVAGRTPAVPQAEISLGR